MVASGEAVEVGRGEIRFAAIGELAQVCSRFRPQLDRARLLRIATLPALGWAWDK